MRKQPSTGAAGPGEISQLVKDRVSVAESTTEVEGMIFWSCAEGVTWRRLWGVMLEAIRCGPGEFKVLSQYRPD